MTFHRFLFTSVALFSCAVWASAQTMGGTGTGTGTGTGSTGSTGGTGTGGLGTGGGVSGGFGGSGGFGSSGGGTGGSGTGFLDSSGLGSTSGGNFLSSGYEPGALGQAGKAGLKTTTSSDLFARYYVNPIAIGNVPAGSTTAITQFGLPLYATLYPGTQIVSPFSANANNVNAAARSGPAGSTGFTPLGSSGGLGTSTYRAPPTYITDVAFKFQPPTPPQVQATIQAVLARSTTLPKGLEVSLDGPIVVLRGNVADLSQRRLAENLVKLTPGVGPVRNELQVAAPAKSGQ